jgi:hypothetical protein
MAKGDVLAVAQGVGVVAAKQTPQVCTQASHEPHARADFRGSTARIAVSSNGAGYVIGSFFALDAEHQQMYLPFASRFIQREHRRQQA